MQESQADDSLSCSAFRTLQPPVAPIDIQLERVLFVRQLGEIALSLGSGTEAHAYSAEADQLAVTINQAVWGEMEKFCLDLMLDGGRAPMATSASYWTLLARVLRLSRLRI